MPVMCGVQHVACCFCAEHRTANCRIRLVHHVNRLQWLHLAHHLCVHYHVALQLLNHHTVCPCSHSTYQAAMLPEQCLQSSQTWPT